MYGTLNPRKEATVAITDSRGYLLSKKSKFSDSFNHNTHVYDTSAARWPKVEASYAALSRTVYHIWSHMKAFRQSFVC